MTYKEAARQALACQNACNLSGVAHTFAEAVSAIWDEARRTGQGTLWVNSHPICTLFIDKLASFNDSAPGLSQAWVGVKNIAVRNDVG